MRWGWGGDARTDAADVRAPRPSVDMGPCRPTGGSPRSGARIRGRLSLASSLAAPGGRLLGYQSIEFENSSGWRGRFSSRWRPGPIRWIRCDRERSTRCLRPPWLSYGSRPGAVAALGGGPGPAGPGVWRSPVAWRVASGAWQFWFVAPGIWLAARGVWRVASGVWQFWFVAPGVWLAARGLWLATRGVWLAARGVGVRVRRGGS